MISDFCSEKSLVGAFQKRNGLPSALLIRGLAHYLWKVSSRWISTGITGLAIMSRLAYFFDLSLHKH